MYRLIVNPGTPQAWEIQLQPGSNSIGRGSANDFQLDDPSISTSHCEIFVDTDSVRIKDPGSTNGTWLDRTRIDEAFLKSGQRLRFGSVELLFETGEVTAVPFPAADAGPSRTATAETEGPTAFVSRSAPASVAPAPASVHAASAAGTAGIIESDVPVFCKNHYQNAAKYKCEKCRRFLCDLCVNTRGTAGGGLKTCKVCAGPLLTVSLQSHVPKEVEFFKAVPAAFKYPVIGDGLILLFCGSFFFVFLDAANYISLHAGKYAQRALMMRAVIITFIIGTGYLFSYLKKIVYATASGEHRMPDWPELSEWQADILAPMFQFLVVCVISFGPALVFRIWFDGEYMWAVWGLMLFGCFYFPMALLGVAMFDSLAALNPLFIIGSILRVPAEYSVVALVFTVILALRVLVEKVLTMVLNIPLVPVLIADLMGIYLLIVQTRILGMLYLARRDTLGWFKRPLS
jgi:FHA domain-containing protein